MITTDDQLVAAETYEEAAAILATHRDDARILAGGQSLALLMRLGFASPQVLVSLRRCPDVTALATGPNEATVGARVTVAAIAESRLRAAAPVVASAAGQIASPHVRNVGTLVGNLCHADPGNDMAAPLLCHDAIAIVASSRGERHLRLEELLASPFVLSLDDDEFVRGCRIPRLDGWRGSYRKVVWRGADHPVTAAAVTLRIVAGVVEDVRVSVGACVAVPRRLPQLEADLRGLEVDASPDLYPMVSDHLAGVDMLEESEISAAYRSRATAAAIHDAVADCTRVGRHHR
ncbi:FAD binding domain-containing protein [Nocardioides terrisoli]|uniref:FAD binding domain-containing protein n=1 Tax=Nocardioides terrisoli TaxID=3388267 RepID=UPI00287BA973|nr:FAD binding domain-containing protein [Nocardioides marmorisolisilvae]